MRFPSARTANEAGIEMLVDPLAPGQFQDLLFVQRGHDGEVVGIEVLVDRERGLFDACPQGIGGSGGDFQLGQPQQILLVAFVGIGSFPGQLSNSAITVGSRNRLRLDLSSILVLLSGIAWFS